MPITQLWRETRNREIADASLGKRSATLSLPNYIQTSVSFKITRIKITKETFNTDVLYDVGLYDVAKYPVLPIILDTLPSKLDDIEFGLDADMAQEVVYDKTVNIRWLKAIREAMANWVFSDTSPGFNFVQVAVGSTIGNIVDNRSALENEIAREVASTSKLSKNQIYWIVKFYPDVWTVGEVGIFDSNNNLLVYIPLDNTLSFVPGEPFYIEIWGEVQLGSFLTEDFADKITSLLLGATSVVSINYFEWQDTVNSLSARVAISKSLFDSETVELEGLLDTATGNGMTINHLEDFEDNTSTTPLLSRDYYEIDKNSSVEVLELQRIKFE